MVFKEDWIVVNEVPSRVKTWGGWIEDPLPPGGSVVICIPGNPGISDFYHSFLNSLHYMLGIPVWIICHAGHEVPPSKLRVSELSPNLFDLAGQVKHKADFIKKYIPAHSTVYLIGHSVGAKIVLELLKYEQELVKQTKMSYLLMPTLELFGNTPNGKFLTNTLKNYMSKILFLAGVFSMFPEFVKRFWIGCWFILSRQHLVDCWCMAAVLNLIQPEVLGKVFSLALDEVKKINALTFRDMFVLNLLCSKIKLYFAQTDNWAPLSYMNHLQNQSPNLDIYMLDAHFYHAFVLDNPSDMADIIAEDVQKLK